MTIREIANLSNVSITTVSKILNHKDQAIKQQTRDRVLQVIKEYNYIPFQEKIASKKVRSNLIGILLDARIEHANLLPSMISTAQSMGYCTIVCRNRSGEEETRNASLLLSHQVDGILWNRISYEDDSVEDLLTERDIPFCIINYNGILSSKNDVSFDFSQIGYLASQTLLKIGHEKTALLLSTNSFRGANLARGFHQCLLDNGISTDISSCVYVDDANLDDDYHIDEYTAFVCENDAIALQISAYLEKCGKHVPEEVSILSIAHTGERDSNLADVSCILLPYDELGTDGITRLVDQIESRQPRDVRFEYALNSSVSLSRPYKGFKSQVAIVGMLNMDTFLRFEKFPEPGETVTIGERYSCPGGKGLNQAAAVRKLSGEPHLIGCTGKDYNGRMIHSYLHSLGISIKSIVSVPDRETGQAYIYVSEGGESSIVVYSGANDALSVEDVTANAEYLRKSAVCLLESELPVPLLCYTAKKAKEYGAKVIMKPCAVNILPPELLSCIDIIVPNEKEIENLVPDADGYRNRAKRLRAGGISTVIVTLGSNGCYVDSPDLCCHYKGIKVDTIDSTGASDAFLGTLAVYLAENNSLDLSIQYAVCAAGLSTASVGVPDSLVDRVRLETYYKEFYPPDMNKCKKNT